VDRITKNLIYDFKKEMEINEENISKLFEYFSAYSIVSKIHSEKFELDDIVGGNGGDCGIDAIAIIVSGILINSIEEIEDLIERSGSISEATFVLIQSKTSSSFNGGEMRTFGDGVLDFFSENPQLVRNEFIQRKAKIVENIIENAARVKTMNCKMFYVTTGKWVEDQNLVSRIEKIKQDIESLNLFKSIDFKPIDAINIQKFYRQTKEKVSTTINFPNKVLLPDVGGVEESYIGILKINEYLKLIEDDLGNIRRSVFYDNVRDYQGENDVNESISNTLRSTKADRLPVLNNGVTIVAKSISVARNNLTLQDYQIVNGCQTSHVIYNNKDYISHEIYLPVKVIASEDDNLVNDVIIANNSQTEVKKEELMALTDFQKRLELFYSSIDDSRKRLYYERRSKQYDAVPNIEKVRIVTISSQIRSFAAMFLDRPHQASRFYGKLLEQLSDVAFVDSHELMPYYTSAFALYKLEFYFRNRSIDSKYRKFKYHLLMMLRYYIHDNVMPELNSKKINKYCETINNELYKNSLLDIFLLLTEVINETVEDINDTEITKRQSLNRELLERVIEIKNKEVVN